MANQISVGIIGGTGYTGVELLRILSRHPLVIVKYLTSRSEAGKSVSEIFPSLRGVCDLAFCDMTDETMAMMARDCDVVFFATPHGVAMAHTPALVEQGVKVIDLGADFRLQSLDEFEQWYGMAHTCPDILKDSVYGLTEVTRAKVATAKVIANPGCYPTTAILGLKPIIDTENMQQQALVDGRIIIDAKSGISGAGRQGKLAISYAETADNFSAYGVVGHRHSPEIAQGVQAVLGADFDHRIRFVPHLVPMIRGMFSTIHVPLSHAGEQVDWQAAFESVYADEYFIDVLPKGVLPDTRSVKASNKLRIAIHQQADMLTVLVVQDNLVKGAAGQAVQNMNVMFGFDETIGLTLVPITP
ncbi:N-acetyl-gamma-glutamyl-phosphate reductase [Moraxella sp. RCAD0137]|uniref:N-acetyl-gamma-glutamyl-phosphate reductase n=1 Tax=Moraxella sp. RCAD0137 TaxID=1775913 RepID=UPI000C9FB622|nr:N-acetyl-gamma-glutamyl-phosphate reductase [Moraxella sp. RCAD0137]PNP98003.1 N-acetyl-gamma-glutamyl-phosphate reductase [Moraxella sp. RCAD0137]